MTNKEFAKVDELFKQACEIGRVAATTRQASKFRLGKGTAYRFRKEAQRELDHKHNTEVMEDAEKELS